MLSICLIILYKYYQGGVKGRSVASEMEDSDVLYSYLTEDFLQISNFTHFLEKNRFWVVQ